ncbi:uncharacterized protein LOC126819062 [Patella vulgata]|uniref:uncharacterized protein LOC126819062 n=1 Tax=Patella vulgata TaxID=6465 RepID=UPI0021804310|nr:uncharacterized protein LOC126819062 [Patella vulgata]XP_050402836.1 uncharacterized protein LOC126819062 [Patella vulgata]XP_050402838.1 uncharacterized protein LOC126819062 [Patella vulgata]XP_050402839.1 uncharacterized protein LOC126819062 [Patella vulgata]XP_050402840.1 uncharacterized protein LOC126819062 [Patella vulgata]XP_050402841.1 uncharacterized protein LOC126819062 [Patella vulgata]
MPLAEERQGYLGKLEDKTISELKDLLYLQEQLLSKQSFLKKLPDKGVKVKQFADILERLIHEKTAIEKSQSIHSSHIDKSSSDIINLTSAFSLKQNGDLSDKVTLAPFSQSHIKDSNNDNLLRSLINPAAFHGGDHKIIIDEREINSSVKNVEQNMEVEDMLSDSFQKVKVSDSVEPTRTFDNSKNCYELVIKRAEQRPKTQKEPFKPNSSLLISKVDDLPNKYKHRSKLNENTDSNNPVDKLQHKKYEESAAYPPRYKYEKAKLVSDEESTELIRQQAAKQAELLAQRAAARLAERLNIKMGPYKPKHVDMSYRQTIEKDSDDDDDDTDDPEMDGYPD